MRLTDIGSPMRKLMMMTDAGTTAHELTEAAITIGRAPENMIMLNDPSVSSRHAQLEVTGDDYQIVDLDSTNGTRVNGQTIRSAVLRPGDRIRFGKVEACFECNVSSEAQPLPALEEPAARPAEVSARPSDFANASPFQKRRLERDRVRTAIYAAAAIAILAFLGSMLALAQMHSPLP